MSLGHCKMPFNLLARRYVAARALAGAPDGVYRLTKSPDGQASPNVTMECEKLAEAARRSHPDYRRDCPWVHQTKAGSRLEGSSAAKSGEDNIHEWKNSKLRVER